MKQSSTPIKSGSILFFKVVILLIATGAFAGMIRFPQTEGRATNLDLVNIYKDPFIIYLYIASIPFFVALYQAFKFLGYLNKNKIFSEDSVKAVGNIKYCAIALMGFIAVAILYIFIISKATNDDGAGAMVVGLITIFASSIVATAAAIFQKRLQNAVGIESGNN